MLVVARINRPSNSPKRDKSSGEMVSKFIPKRLAARWKRLSAEASDGGIFSSGSTSIAMS
ncbi:Uncharacterised protein [Vibrio cholerae]|nr:Uncharacterised protein [Vibrio cholerae]CSC00353.1 Uncharacterised protein [Vibrio cholerae]CSC23738.1 Uncharacterised protein [Vibrio cholerae]CSC90913.1 Uncharacterised protein [Vibrio cholerae]CSD47409.1 Uncharacterised protein [Vibrio cholerae]